MSFWKNLSIFFGGIITGILIYMKLKNPDTKIIAENYIDEQEQKIGKIKQKGQGNAQKVEAIQELNPKKAARKTKQAARRSKRQSRKTTKN